MVKCLICLKNYITSKAMKRHMREYHNPKNKCIYCSKYVIRIGQHLKYCKMKKLRKSLTLTISDNNFINKRKKSQNYTKINNKKIFDNIIDDYNYTPIKNTDFIYFKDLQLGKGGWGSIFYGLNVKDKNKVAIKKYIKKVEDIDIDWECCLAKDLESVSLAPKLYYYNSDEKIFVQSLLGPNLEVLFNFCERKFSTKTIANIGIEIIDRLESLHNIGFIHRDITPKNVVWLNFSDYQSIDKDNLILIDFGVSGAYITKDNKHIQFKENDGIYGTQYFSSIYSSKGNTQNRRDDIEALFYCLCYFFNGILPWDSSFLKKNEIKSKEMSPNLQKNYTKNSFRNEVLRILKIKESLNPSEMCNKMPSEFKIIFSYIKNLDFEEKPDYDSIKLLLRNIILKEEMKDPNQIIYKYTWEKKIKDLIDSKKFIKSKIKIIKDKLFPGHPLDLKELLKMLKMKI